MPSPAIISALKRDIQQLRSILVIKHVADRRDHGQSHAFPGKYVKLCRLNIRIVLIKIEYSNDIKI